MFFKWLYKAKMVLVTALYAMDVNLKSVDAQVIKNQFLVILVTYIMSNKFMSVTYLTGK